jgi:RNA polymerase sigma-70 factor (ECF subfamily)
MADVNLDDELRRSLIGAWHHYLEALDPLRPALFRYCRRLTGNVWDGEDLVQDTLLRGFSKLSHVLYRLRNPRAYLLRIATNLWRDALRTRAVEHAALAEQERTRDLYATSPPPEQSTEVRAAAAVLMQRLAPQERAAVLLAEIFDLSLEDTASILETSIGAAKSALHRGRERLKNAELLPPSPRPRCPEALLDRFVHCYNARDLPGLLALMRDDATIEMHGFEEESGREGFERSRGWFHHNFYSPFDGSPTRARWQVAAYEDQPIVLVFGAAADESMLTSVMRIEGGGQTVERIHVYALCPDVVREVATHLGLEFQTLGYRFPFDVSATACD